MFFLKRPHKMKKNMKNSVKNTLRLMFVIICTTTLMSCAKDICPTYMNSIQKVKSIRGQNTENPADSKTVPSPYKNDYTDQVKKKYVVVNDDQTTGKIKFN